MVDIHLTVVTKFVVDLLKNTNVFFYIFTESTMYE